MSLIAIKFLFNTKKKKWEMRRGMGKNEIGLLSNLCVA